MCVCPPQDPEPTLAGPPLTFFRYDLSSVRLSRVAPNGAPRGVATRVTLVGSGFVDAGPSEAACEFEWPVGSSPSLVPATLLDAERAVCELPPLGSASEPHATLRLVLSASLHNRSLATSMASAEALTFFTYAPPVVHTITPRSSAAFAAQPYGRAPMMVHVMGSGFDAYAVAASNTAAAAAAAAGAGAAAANGNASTAAASTAASSASTALSTLPPLRCAFGGSNGTAAILSDAIALNDTTVLCEAPWPTAAQLRVQQAIDAAGNGPRSHPARAQAHACQERSAAAPCPVPVD